MKKLFVFMFASIVCGTLYSQTSQSDATGSFGLNEGKIVSTFYGSKASSKANNPCKGATTRICGKVETYLEVITYDQTKVTQKVKDIDGELISIFNFCVAQPLQEAKESMKIEILNLGGTLDDCAEE